MTFSDDGIRAMPVLDERPLKPICDLSAEVITMEMTTQFWIDPEDGIGYDIVEHKGRWCRAKNGMIDRARNEEYKHRNRIIKRPPFINWAMPKYDFLALCEAMKPGDSIRFDPWQLSKSFPVGFPSIYDRLDQAILSCLMGSAYGRFVIREEFGPDLTMVIFRHEPQKKRVYVDPDRRYLFDRMPDGSLELKPDFYDCYGQEAHVLAWHRFRHEKKLGVA